MDSPLKHHFDPAERPDCLDVSPERLNPMTAAQLERELEAALDRKYPGAGFPGNGIYERRNNQLSVPPSDPVSTCSRLLSGILCHHSPDGGEIM